MRSARCPCVFEDGLAVPAEISLSKPGIQEVPTTKRLVVLPLRTENTSLVKCYRDTKALKQMEKSQDFVDRVGSIASLAPIRHPSPIDDGTLVFERIVSTEHADKLAVQRT